MADELADGDTGINPFRMLFKTVPESQTQSQSQSQSQEEAAASSSATPTVPIEQIHHLESINSTILTRQLPSQGLSFQLWPAATALVSFLNRLRRKPTPHPLSALFNTHSPLRILELGSGTGLVGIAAAAIFGANVTLTDLPYVLPNLHFNIDANSAVLEANGAVIDAAALSWGDNDHMEGFGRDYDLILGSDLVYHDHLYEPLLKTLKFFLIENVEKKIVFLMAHLRRWKKESVFFKKARKMFDVEIVHTDSPSQGTRVGVVVYKFRAKSSSAKLA